MATRSLLQRFTHVLISAIALVSTLVPMSLALAGPNAFSFDADPVGQTAEQFAVPGISLSSPFIPNSWRVVNSNGNFVTLGGNVLMNRGCEAALIVELDHIHTEMSLRFAIDPNAAVFIVDGWLGDPGPGTKVFTRQSVGNNLGSPIGWREGAVRSSGIRFDHLVIYAPGGCEAIDRFATS